VDINRVPTSLNNYFRGQLEQDRAAYAEAETQAAAEGTTADIVWLRWKQHAQELQRQHDRLRPETGLTLGQQQAANGRVAGIAQAARVARERAEREQSTEFGRSVAFQEKFHAKYGRWPSLEEREIGQL
jgi:hypothetical protein